MPGELFRFMCLPVVASGVKLCIDCEVFGGEPGGGYAI